MSGIIRTALLLIVLVVALPAAAQIVVPPGNRFEKQPDVPFGSSSRTRGMDTTFQAKYAKVLHLLESDQGLRDKIKLVAGRYDIDPIHIVGAIVGEHTYNVDAYDRLQTYYVKAFSYVNIGFSFKHAGESVDDFINRPQFAECDELTESYELWICRETVWDREFRGRSVDGQLFPNNRFSAVFFQPFYAGQTFGLGQLNPLTALQMTDLVHEVSGFPKLDHRDPQGVYRTIMDPDITLAYVAATLKKSIDAYRKIAGFDISDNPGITATLYNVGNPEERAHALKTENQKRRRNGLAPRMPEENYYGWLVNEKLDELEALLEHD